MRFEEKSSILFRVTDPYIWYIRAMEADEIFHLMIKQVIDLVLFKG